MAGYTFVHSSNTHFALQFVVSLHVARWDLAVSSPLSALILTQCLLLLQPSSCIFRTLWNSFQIRSTTVGMLTSYHLLLLSTLLIVVVYFPCPQPSAAKGRLQACRHNCLPSKVTFFWLLSCHGSFKPLIFMSLILQGEQPSFLLLMVTCQMFLSASVFTGVLLCSHFPLSFCTSAGLVWHPSFVNAAISL